MFGSKDDAYGADGVRWRDRLAGAGIPRLALGTVAGLVVLGILYYGVGALWVGKVDDDTAFAAAQPTAGGSRTVDIAAALIEREVESNGWTANDPFFMPGAVLDNMPHFQQGILYALGRFTVEMADQIGRARGSSQVDPDLDRASGLLKYPGTVWIFDFSTSLAPTASSEQQYRAARRALIAYNQRLSEGNAAFERRADNLLATIDRIASDLGSASAIIDTHIERSSGRFIDTEADDIFYSNKGRIYAYYLLLRELGADFEAVIVERQLQTVWDQALESLRQAAELQPAVVVNGSPDSQILPSHLASQGFYLLRGRTQLREVSNVLLK